MHDAAEMNGLLDREGRRGTESVETEPIGLGPIIVGVGEARDAGEAEGPVADHSAAQQGRRIGIGERVRQANGHVGANRQRLRIAPIPIPAGERRVRAQVLAA